jgi:GT2 family glycosyltransferase
MPDASIVIVTRNQREKLKRAVESALSQTGDIEVLVIDDASTDDTVEMLRKAFPTLQVHARQKREGYIVQRNLGARLATGPIIFSIDDDAFYVDPDVVRDTLKLFDVPNVGAATIPHYNMFPGEADRLMSPEAPPDQAYVTNTFIGTAYALRRDVFLDLGGFQEALFHWGEETEFTQRLLSSGYFVRVGTRARIHHFPAAIGKFTTSSNRYIYRNRMLTVWLNAPTLYLIPLLFLRSAVAIKDVFVRAGSRVAACQGLLMGWGTVVKYFGRRKPVSLRSFRLWLLLRKRRMVPMAEVAEAAAQGAVRGKALRNA